MKPDLFQEGNNIRNWISALLKCQISLKSISNTKTRNYCMLLSLNLMYSIPTMELSINVVVSRNVYWKILWTKMDYMIQKIAWNSLWIVESSMSENPLTKEKLLSTNFTDVVWQDLLISRKKMLRGGHLFWNIFFK